MFIDIVEYMKMNLVERQEHLRLEEPCIERGGFHNNFRGVLAEHLGTTFPSGMMIHLCHACNNGKCSNPHHMYWGTARENYIDRITAGVPTIGEHYMMRYSATERSEHARKNGLKNGGKNKGVPQTIETKRKNSESNKLAWTEDRRIRQSERMKGNSLRKNRKQDYSSVV